MKDPQGKSPASSSKTPHKNGRIAAAAGGGTKTQNERLTELKDLLVDQHKRGKRNPALQYKTGWELANILGVDERTVRRDIKALNLRREVPADFIRERGGYGLTEDVGSFPAKEFSRSDYFSLWMSVQAFQAWGGLPYQKRLPALMRKLQSSSQALSPADLKQMQKCVTFKAGGFEAPLDQDIFLTVIDALLHGQELEFEYQSLDVQRAGALKIPTASGLMTPTDGMERLVDSEGRRRVQPLHALCWEYAWYLFAYDYARRDIRTFAIGRMLSAENNGKKFKQARPFDLEKELEDSFGIRRGGKAENVHLRFESAAVPLVIERLWHHSQVFTLHPDKTLEMTMRVAICPELIRWVAGWRDDVEVLGPSSLQDAIEESAARIAERRRKRLKARAR